MRNTDLKLSLPPEMSDTFCTILGEYGINHSAKNNVNSGPSLAVNSAQETAKEIVIELINSEAFWAAFSACFIAYTNRKSSKKVVIKNGDKEMSLENASHLEVKEFIENSSEIVFKDSSDK